MAKRKKQNNKIFLIIKVAIFFIYIPLFLLLKLILIIVNIKQEQKKQTKKNIYHIKEKTITNNEIYFYNIIKKHFGKDFDIRVQIPLSSVIEKEKKFENQYQNELYKVIDIGIFDKNTTAPLLLIEINDSTHNKNNRKARDNKVKNICEQAGLTLISFWTKYSNTEKYIINKIKNNLKN